MKIGELFVLPTGNKAELLGATSEFAEFKYLDTRQGTVTVTHSNIFDWWERERIAKADE